MANYTITDIVMGSVVSNTSLFCSVNVIFSGLVALQNYGHKLPYVVYIDENNNQHVLSNCPQGTSVASGNVKLTYSMLKINYSVSPTRCKPYPGMYIVYNPTDKTNNIGKAVDSAGNGTALDLETLQKYAPWRIYPALS